MHFVQSDSDFKLYDDRYKINRKDKRSDFKHGNLNVFHGKFTLHHGGGGVSRWDGHCARNAQDERRTLLFGNLQRAQLQELRAALDERGRVRKIAQGGGLAARAFESGKPFLPSLDDLCEQLLQLTREGQISDGHLFEHEAQTLRGGLVDSRLTFRFEDGSLYDETVVFSQRGVFELVHYRLVQQGPSFPESVNAQFERASGQYRGRVATEPGNSMMALAAVRKARTRKGFSSLNSR